MAPLIAEGDCRDGNPVHFSVTLLHENRDKKCGAETFKFNDALSPELLDHKCYASFVLRHGLQELLLA